MPWGGCLFSTGSLCLGFDRFFTVVARGGVLGLCDIGKKAIAKGFKAILQWELLIRFFEITALNWKNCVLLHLL